MPSVAANAAIGTWIGTGSKTISGVGSNPAIGLVVASNSVEMATWSIEFSTDFGPSNKTVAANPAIGIIAPIRSAILLRSVAAHPGIGPYAAIGKPPLPPPPPPIPAPPPPPGLPQPTLHSLVTQTPSAPVLPPTGPIPAVANRISLASALMSTIGCLSGVATNYNKGSLVRNFALAQGSELERQGIISSAKVTQNIAYSLMNIFNISASAAIPATGVVICSVPIASRISVAIPQGAILQTAQAIQFRTTQAAIILAGQTSVTVPIQAVVGGVTGNVLAGAITQVLSGISIPLLVKNVTPTTGGVNQQSISVALADLAAKIASLNLNSPVSVANACIGVTVPGTNEVVSISTCVENWVYQIATSGTIRGFVPTPGFALYIDNGAGSASPALISAVQNVIDGNLLTGQKGYRPAGVPYTVNPTNPVLASLVVSGTTTVPGDGTIASGLIQSEIGNYFRDLQFGQPAFASELSAQLVNAGLGLLDSLTVYLYYNSNLHTPVSVVTGAASTRILLATDSPTINLNPVQVFSESISGSPINLANGNLMEASWTNSTGSPIRFMQATIVVPPYPLDTTGSGYLNLWMGLQDNAFVLQPVLEYNAASSINGAPLNGAWVLFNSYNQINGGGVNEETTAFVVTPGTVLTAIVFLSSFDKGIYTYICEWVGFPSIDLTIARKSPLTTATVSFEAYETFDLTSRVVLSSIDKLPNVASSTFSNITLATLADATPAVSWSPTTIPTFGQSVVVVDNTDIELLYRGPEVNGNEVLASWINGSGSPISLMKTTFTVPPAPSNVNGHVFLWTGMYSADGKVNMSNVLAWFNNQWQIYNVFYDRVSGNFIPNGLTGKTDNGALVVTPGTVLTSQIFLSSFGGGQFGYSAQFVGQTSIDYSVILLTELTQGTISLEAYEDVWQTKQLTTCNKLPNTASTTFSNVTFNTVATTTPTISWTTATGVVGSINCGQSVQVVNNSTITINY